VIRPFLAPLIATLIQMRVPAVTNTACLPSVEPILPAAMVEEKLKIAFLALVAEKKRMVL